MSSLTSSAQRPPIASEAVLVQATWRPPLISRCRERRQERLDDRHDPIGGGQSGSVIESGELVDLDPESLRRTPVHVRLVLAAAVDEAGRGYPAEVDVVREKPSPASAAPKARGSFTRSW